MGAAEKKWRAYREKRDLRRMLEPMRRPRGDGRGEPVISIASIVQRIRRYCTQLPRAE